MTIVAYAYDSGLHCPDCAKLRFPGHDDDTDENGIDRRATDCEHNTITVVFSHEHDADGEVCDDCQAELMPVDDVDGEESCMEHEHCDKCNTQLEAGRIGLCDGCSDDEDVCEECDEVPCVCGDYDDQDEIATDETRAYGPGGAPPKYKDDYR